MPPAIRVHNLGKRYRISHEGDTHGKYRTLRDSVMDLAKAPLRKLSTLARRGNGNAGVSPASKEDFWALKDVSFDVQPGEVVGIIGRNGAGKSTLLKILSRITKPTTGSVELNGRVGSLLEVGTGFHPELTGRENIFLNGSILGMKRAEIQKQFDAIVDFSGVEKFLDTPVKRYSSGMQVKLAFAVAAHLSPEILLVDEVLAVGDLAFQRKCISRMGRIAESGRTIFLVSHQLPQITRLCTAAYWFQSGSIQKRGKPQEVVDAYVQDQINDQSGAVDLRQRKRSQGLPFVFRHISLTDKNRHTSSAVPIGGEFSVNIQMEPKEARRVADIAISFRDITGTQVAQAASCVQSDLDLSRAIGGNIVCAFSDFRLLPGEYSIDVFAGDGEHHLDRVEDVLRLTVVPADLYGTGRVPRKSEGYLALNVEWSIERQDLTSISTPSRIT